MTFISSFSARVVLSLPFVASLLGCGSSQYPNHGHGHAAGHEMPHRFDDPARWAAEFDDPSRDAWQKPQEVIALMRLAPGMTAADLGAGTGYFEAYLSKAVGSTGRVLALDVERAMVDYLKQRATKEGLANVEGRVVARETAGLEQSSVDRVLVVNTWHHLPDRARYASELAAALRPTGEIVIVDFTLETDKGPAAKHKLSPEAVIAELTAAGLQGEVLSEKLPDQYIVVGRKPAGL